MVSMSSLGRDQADNMVDWSTWGTNQDRNGKVRRVLVVDDSPAILRPLKMFLTLTGYLVATASSGEAALEAAKRFKPDLIILDFSLPGIDGLETCCRLRVEAGAATIPIIMMSARTDTDLRDQAFDTGANVFLPKPFSFDELSHWLEELAPLQ